MRDSTLFASSAFPLVDITVYLSLLCILSLIFCDSFSCKKKTNQSTSSLLSQFIDAVKDLLTLLLQWDETIIRITFIVIGWSTDRNEITLSLHGFIRCKSIRIYSDLLASESGQFTKTIRVQFNFTRCCFFFLLVLFLGF